MGALTSLSKPHRQISARTEHRDESHERWHLNLAPRLGYSYLKAAFIEIGARRPGG